MRTIALDAYPLSQICNAQNSQTAVAIRLWRRTCEAAGNRFVVPEVADYEVRRELIRRNAGNSLTLLDTFLAENSIQYLPITTADMRLAVALWASARNAGTPTASPLSLDGDAIIAAQALSRNLPPMEIIVATSNPKHLSLFIAAEEWQNIVP